MSIVGARPQFIKLGPLSKIVRESFNEIVVHTGQHYDYNMSQSFFEELGIPKPDYFLEVGSGSHAVQTGEMLSKLEHVLLKEIPDLVVVFGDTNSTLAGALAAAKLQIKTVHIEAGLRSFNKSMPEEVNRIVSDHVSDFLFVPTYTGMSNLINEGLGKKAILTGDIMVDSVKLAASLSQVHSSILTRYGFDEGGYYLLTLHRPYNVDDPQILEKILDNLLKLSLPVIFPVHPRTKKLLDSNSIKIPENFVITEPQGYFDFLALQGKSKAIITDSGGIQKEACILRKPCITLRTETEWTETIQAGVNILINPTEDLNISRIEKFNPDFDSVGPIFGENVASGMLMQIKNILE
ncbi:MAG: UDP-2,3-diacetamido-2,3-dideoxy-D-glucuronate 2-epimerase [Ignavibacteriaceae bacterium]|nr:UDP-2,3-diacetamido-2,3-dideoxy-D-glucuronate 2-epimerase [Ignavibacteriaceae bacterium]